MGSFRSDMTNPEENRLHNIGLAIKAIDGTILKPGEVFSFNTAVGPATEERGYLEAIIYVGGQETDGCGGGICQVSSTIYAAALDANMTIVERHPHDGPQVHYVPAGMDATIAYDNLDLKIQNNYDNPVRIACRLDQDGVYVDLLEMKTE